MNEVFCYECGRQIDSLCKETYALEDGVRLKTTIIKRLCDECKPIVLKRGTGIANCRNCNRKLSTIHNKTALCRVCLNNHIHYGDNGYDDDGYGDRLDGDELYGLYCDDYEINYESVLYKGDGTLKELSFSN